MFCLGFFDLCWQFFGSGNSLVLAVLWFWQFFGAQSFSTLCQIRLWWHSKNEPVSPGRTQLRSLLAVAN